MGRNKSYERDDLVDRAMDLFRDHGFAGTSTQMLVEALGVNRYSVYAEFGSKQALFDAALERYDALVVDRNFSPLEAPGAGVEEIRALFSFFAAASKGPAAGRGCLLCNTAVEFGPKDPGGAGFVRRYFKRIRKAFQNALGNANDRGDLLTHVAIRDEADFFTSAVLGLFVMLRAKAPPSAVKNAARVATEHLQTLMPPA